MIWLPGLYWYYPCIAMMKVSRFITPTTFLANTIVHFDKERVSQCSTSNPVSRPCLNVIQDRGGFSFYLLNVADCTDSRCNNSEYSPYCLLSQACSFQTAHCTLSSHSWSQCCACSQKHYKLPRTVPSWEESLPWLCNPWNNHLDSLFVSLNKEIMMLR